MLNEAGSLDYSNKTVLVVGGSSGIGRGIARAFHARGANVAVWGTRASIDDYDAPEQLDGIAYSQVDVTDERQVRGAPTPSKLDVLILSQGTVRYGRKEFTVEEFRSVVDVNLSSMMACAERFQPLLAESGGSIIMIASSAAYRAARGNPAYAASKAGVVGLTGTLGQAWAASGVRVNGIAPGYVDTKLTEVMTKHAGRRAELISSIPLGRLGESEDIADVALFLASPMARYIVGQTIVVDGGVIL